PSLTALGEGSHGSILNGNYAPNRLSSAWKPTLGIKVEAGPVVSVEPGADMITVTTATRAYAFASLYPALGSDIRSGLAAELGARVSGEGCIDVDAHQRTSVPGLYAAGDVVIGLDQISHAMGQAGVAATAIRNDLCEIETLVR
ncbi:pyruvate/2-oxoglutarate dehydrogenase complex dihydrolipoamide dehydrogenase (E3) component, partial [Shinella sp. BE166]|uniref:FAD-dependent oxidoreductase n=1 Tax=Shinella sp. BE166 TaxID=3373918 RepID=UPI003EBFF9D7